MEFFYNQVHLNPRSKISHFYALHLQQHIICTQVCYFSLTSGKYCLSHHQHPRVRSIPWYQILFWSSSWNHPYTQSSLEPHRQSCIQPPAANHLIHLRITILEPLRACLVRGKFFFFHLRLKIKC